MRTFQLILSSKFLKTELTDKCVFQKTPKAAVCEQVTECDDHWLQGVHCTVPPAAVPFNHIYIVSTKLSSGHISTCKSGRMAGFEKKFKTVATLV